MIFFIFPIASFLRNIHKFSKACNLDKDVNSTATFHSNKCIIPSSCGATNGFSYHSTSLKSGTHFDVCYFHTMVMQRLSICLLRPFRSSRQQCDQVSGKGHRSQINVAEQFQPRTWKCCGASGMLFLIMLYSVSTTCIMRRHLCYDGD